MLLHSRAPAPLQVEHNTVPDTQNLIDVDGPHIASVGSNFESQSIQTDSQQERLEREAHDAAIETKKASKDKARAAKKEAKSAISTLKDNSDNPVFIGNGILAAAAAGVVGYGAYRRFSGQTTTPDGWTVGTVAAAFGVIAVGDYFVSRWALQNKYPAKS